MRRGAVAMISLYKTPGDMPNPGVTRCPCCGDDHYGPKVLCVVCADEGCQWTADGAGDYGYWDCQAGGTELAWFAAGGEVPADELDGYNPLRRGWL